MLSGPSGVGKGALRDALMADLPDLQCSVSVTTRSPRAGEVDGKHYFFVDSERFKEMMARGELLEWANVYSNHYGTPRAHVEASISAGTDIVLTIDVQGAVQIRQKFPEAVLIFIVPPSIEALKARMEKRGADPSEVVAERLKCAVAELRQAGLYDYVVVNDDLHRAVDILKAIMKAEKCRARNNLDMVPGLLDSCR